ncbi:MAG: hypothetical protein ACP5N1_01355 [Candidatus Woesearchaeota archaeon]
MKYYEDEFKHTTDADLKELILYANIFKKIEPIYIMLNVHKNIDKTFSEIMKDVTDDYNRIPEGKNKEFISYFINFVNNNFIKYNDQEYNMTKKDTSKNIEKICDVAINLGRNFFRTVDKTNFINDVVDVCHTGELEAKEKDSITKIYDYYVFAEYAKNKYKDNEIYNSLRKKCVQAYKSIISEECKGLILKYVDKDFLKVK